MVITDPVLASQVIPVRGAAPQAPPCPKHAPLFTGMCAQVLRSKLLDKIRFEYSFLDPVQILPPCLVQTHVGNITRLCWHSLQDVVLRTCMCSSLAARIF